MTSKRELKKYIHAVCGDLAAELLIARAVNPGFDEAKVQAIIAKIATLQVNALAHANFSFDRSEAEAKAKADGEDYRKAKREYNKKAYAKLIEQFSDGVDEIVKDMNEAMPPEVREEHKEALKD